MSEYIVEAKHVNKGYRVGKSRLEVLKDINWRIERERWTALLGASGSGKTTLLNLLGGLERADTGELWFNGELMNRWSGRQLARFRAYRLGFVFQSYQLLPELTLLENVTLPSRLAGMSTRQCRNKATALLERFGLADRLKHHPNELSGGEQQRAAIARALIKDPEILLADEPTGNLDRLSGEAILALLDELRRTEKLTVVMITHNEQIARRADAVARLCDGMIATDESSPMI